jgi:hypothetical protein
MRILQEERRIFHAFFTKYAGIAAKSAQNTGFFCEKHLLFSPECVIIPLLCMHEEIMYPEIGKEVL